MKLIEHARTNQGNPVNVYLYISCTMHWIMIIVPSVMQHIVLALQYLSSCCRF